MAKGNKSGGFRMGVAPKSQPKESTPMAKKVLGGTQQSHGKDHTWDCSQESMKQNKMPSKPVNESNKNSSTVTSNGNMPSKGE